MVFQKGDRMLSVKCIQILWKLGKHNGYHLMNMANTEKNLQNISTYQKLGLATASKDSCIPHL